MATNGNNRTVRLSARIPDVSKLSDLFEQLKTELGKVNVPGLPLKEIAQLSQGFNVTLPDTSSWSKIIVPDSADLLKNFPNPLELASGLGEPLSRAQEIVSFNFSGTGRRFQDILASVEPPKLDNPKAYLDSIVAPLSTITSLLESPDIAALLKAIGTLTGLESLEKLPRDLNILIARLQKTLTSKYGGVILAVVSTGAATTLGAKTERFVNSAAGSFSFESAKARFEKLLEAYAGGIELMGNLDLADSAQVGAATVKLRSIGEAFDTYRDGLVRELAFTEASLAALDLESLKGGIKLIGDTMAEVDSAPISELADSINNVLKRIKESLTFDGDFTITRYKEMVKSGLPLAKAELDKLDPGQIQHLFQDLSKKITQPFEKLDEFKTELEVVVRGAFQTVQDAIAQVDLTPLRNNFEQAIAQLEAKLGEIDKLFVSVRTTIEDSLNQAKIALGAAREFVLDPNTGLKKQIEDVFGSVFDLLDKINIQGTVQEISATLQPVSVELDKIDIASVIDATVDVINTISDVLKTVGPLLVTDALKEKLVEATQFLRQIDFDGISDALVDAFDEILASIDVEALGRFEAEYQKVVEAIDKFDPSPMLEEVQREVFDPILEEMEKLKPAELLQPLQEGYDSALEALGGFDPKATLSFIVDFFDELTAKVHELSPQKLLEPIERALTEIRGAINSALRIDDLLAAVEQASTFAAPEITRLDLHALSDGLEPALARFKTAIGEFDPESFADPIAAALRGVFERVGINLNREGIQTLFAAFKSGTAGLDGKFAALSQSLRQGQVEISRLDLKSDLMTLRTRHGELRGALTARSNGGSTQLELSAIVESFDPIASLSPLLPKVTRVQTAFAAKSEQFGQVAQTLSPMFQSVDQVLKALGAFLSPVELLQEMFLGMLRRLFPDMAFSSVKELLLHFIDEINPTQWRPELESLLKAFQAKLSALLGGAVLDPLADLLNSIKATIELLNISVLTESINKVFAEVEATIQQFNPTPLIQAMAETYKRILDVLGRLNPAEFIAQIDSLYTNDVIGVVKAISPEDLLLQPLQELFQRIKGLLVAFNIKVIFEPILTSLQSLRDQLADGLDRAGEAFDGLIASIPTGSAEVSVTASVQV